MVLPIARTHAWELYGRMKRVARSHRAPARVRATTASFRAPASDFSPSLSLFGFVSKERRGTFLRFACSCSRFVHTGRRRTRSIHFIHSCIHSDRVLRPRVRLPRRSCAHIRENTSFSGRGVRGVASRVWDRRECTRFDWTLRDPDGWMDPDPGGDRDCVRVMRRRRVRDRGDDGGCVVERSFFSSTRSEAMVYEVVLVFIDVRTKRG